MPEITTAMRTCTPAAPLSEDHLQQLRTREIENCKKELETSMAMWLACTGRTLLAAWWKGHIEMHSSLMCHYFPTCQVRVVRFYVSLFSFSFSSASSSASSSVTLSCRDSVSSVWHAGPQPRSCEFSVACWTPTAILVSAVWRAGPQLRSCEFSVACRTPTASS